MDIASILSNSTDTSLTTSAVQKESKAASSFENYLLEASDTSSDTTSSTSTSDTSSNSGLEEFMQYAKETPAQRIFDSWLSSQKITEDQYNAMTPAEKQTIMDKFEAQMKSKLGSETTASLTASVAA
jgi:hypothetical protein